MERDFPSWQEHPGSVCPSWIGLSLLDLGMNTYALKNGGPGPPRLDLGWEPCFGAGDGPKTFLSAEVTSKPSNPGCVRMKGINGSGVGVETKGGRGKICLEITETMVCKLL